MPDRDGVAGNAGGGNVYGDWRAGRLPFCSMGIANGNIKGEKCCLTFNGGTCRNS
ncbi:MAG: hypothetical protein HXO10_09255 [Prevotella salivae]|nr:hypothetical protein [Segatella salivae]